MNVMVRPSISVLFGSQTGTAEEVAERIGRECRCLHLQARVCAMDDYALENLIKETLVIFIASTTGQGDPPDNMKKFWKFLLRKNLPLNSLSNVHVAVLGLGDSSYLKFNFIAKKLHRRLVQLGATSILDVGLADEQHSLGLDAVIDPWTSSLLEILVNWFPLPTGMQVKSRMEKPPPRFRVHVIDEDYIGDVESLRLHSQGLERLADRYSGTESFTKERPFLSKVLANTRVTASHHFQDVRLVSFDLKGSGISYSPGDVLMVRPCNVDRKVTEFLSQLGWNEDAKVTVRQNCVDFTVPHDVPSSCTLRYLFKHYFDIQATPRRYFFELLAHFTNSEIEKERLMEFCTAEGQEDLYEYCYRPKRNYSEVLQDFPDAAARLELNYIFDLFPPMRPRAFSIASSFAVTPESVEILVAVVKYRTKMLHPREGVCSTWLSSIEPGGSPLIPVWVVPGTIAFPDDPYTPVIMIGPGTGCAPFRSFIQERALLPRSGKLVLFFGSRNQGGDFYFEDEWLPLVTCGKLRLFTAFSRDQTEKVYVQHRMRDNGAFLWNLIDVEKASVYLAGNSKDMPADVIQCLKDIFRICGGMSEGEAEEYFKELEVRRRFQCETWS